MALTVEILGSLAPAGRIRYPYRRDCAGSLYPRGEFLLSRLLGRSRGSGFCDATPVLQERGGNGGLLVLAAQGAGGWSLDARREG